MCIHVYDVDGTKRKGHVGNVFVYDVDGASR